MQLGRFLEADFDNGCMAGLKDEEVVCAFRVGLATDFLLCFAVNLLRCIV